MELHAVTNNTSFFSLRYPALIRIWHWLTFLFISAAMVTVLFASTVFDIKRGPEPGKDKGQKTGLQQEPPKAKEGEQPRFDPSKFDPDTRAAFKYRNKIWDAHKIIGFGLCFLLLSRVVIEVSRKKEERLITRINNAVGIPTISNESRREKKHYLLVKSSYLFFYVLLLLMSATGLLMAFDHTPFLKPFVRPAHELHEIGQYLMYAYVLFHIAGVIRADLYKQRGIVSAMINGGN